MEVTLTDTSQVVAYDVDDQFAIENYNFEIKKLLKEVIFYIKRRGYKIKYKPQKEVQIGHRSYISKSIFFHKKFIKLLIIKVFLSIK